jgi:hypothetical protein
MDDQQLSLSVRLRRVRTETATVSVPITDGVISPDAEGSRKIDVDKVIEAALRLGNLDSTHWDIEKDPEITLHPIQTPPAQDQ